MITPAKTETPPDLLSSQEVSRLVPGDYADVNRIIAEHGLSPFQPESFAGELSRTDSLTFCRRNHGSVVSFIAMRLITINKNEQDSKSGDPPEIVTVSEPLKVYEAEIQQIGTQIEFHRLGLAQSLLDESLRVLKARSCKEIWLEVRNSNKTAQTFYFRNGFEVISVRKDYYAKPREDALVCRLKLGS